ncbi:MAG: S8 family serine peptidase [Propionibacteriales bacterium]|nr:S8 family serine peptidase [Propionibacteriales bacterium]
MKSRVRARIVLTGLIVPLLLLGATAVPGAANPEPAAPPEVSAEDLEAEPLSPTGRVEAGKSASSRLARTSQALLRRDDANPVRVMVKLDYDALASYQGGVGGLRPTSPSVTERSFSLRSPAAREYRSYLVSQEKTFVQALSDAVPEADVTRRYRVVYGGVAATIPANSAERILALDGVAAVQLDRVRKPLTDASPAFVNAPPVYDELGTTENAGEGTILGNLDTGIWPEHPSFEDQGNLQAPPGPARECNYGDNPLTEAEDPFQCQNKLIGGAHFTDSYDACAAAGDCLPDPYIGTARDGDGHGTHTSSTSAGNALDSAPVFGVDRGPLHGLAPGAWVMEYKVCGPEGCFASDSAAAVGQAILDGVDAINFSISGGTQPFSDPVELAFLDAYAANVFVSTSAGNEGPGAATANHLSPWVTTVGASTQTREFSSTLSLTAANGDEFTASGVSITQGIDSPLPVVRAEDIRRYGDPLCGTAPRSDSVFDGMIVACQRGEQARVFKGFNVFQGGGEGMILYNPELMDVETDNHWLPTVHLADGTDFVAFMQGHGSVTGSFTAGEARDGQGDVMAAFSSRGPAGRFIKPDVTAPGVQILAGASPTPAPPEVGGGPPGEFFQAIAGTSMSSPHVAGAGLLVRAVHPDWTPGQIKSALMTTSITDVVKEDLTTPADPFDMGAGRIDLGASVRAGIAFDETAENFFAMGDDPVQSTHLNVPSINAPVMPGRLTTTRVATNPSGGTERFTVTTDAPEGSTITVSPGTFRVDPGESVTLTITIESEAPLGEQQFGSVELVPGGGGSPLHLPVAFVHTQGEVNLTQSCSPETVQRGELSRCDVEAANNSLEEQTVDLDTFTTKGLPIVETEGAELVGRRHAQLHDVTLAGFDPGIPAVDPGASPAGYLPLDELGVAPVPIGDEQIINFNLTGATFEYAGQSWNRIGVDSNGYLVVGGGTAEDNDCCNLPAGPDPVRPNNMLAPLWSDLDGTDAEGIFPAVLSDEAGNSWLVIEFRLNDFGGDVPRVFQVWMGLNGTEDISYAYDPDNLPTDLAWPFLVGAENIRGEGDMEAVLPTGDLRVVSSDLVPGDRVSYAVVVRGRQPGVHEVRTEMEASLTPGVTIERDEIRVAGRR